ncbi:MAG: acyl-CoA dehydrogenase family protein [Myxococcota bacterium]|nr:acyl-CoA dehydrogenase family protein [Myxococcota bacterium]
MEIYGPANSALEFSYLFDRKHQRFSQKLSALNRRWVPQQRDDWSAVKEALSALADEGLLNLCVPPAHGGPLGPAGRPEDVDLRLLVMAREQLAWADGILDFAFAMQGLGSYGIHLSGDLGLAAEYYPGVITGDRVGAFALTEAEAGSDVAQLRCRVTPVGDDQYRIRGKKTFISNAGLATQYIVFASHLKASNKKKDRRGDISAFIVNRDDPGLKIEPFEVMAPHPIGTLHFTNCVIPARRRLGAEGEGFRIAMESLNTFRLSVAGAALGMAKRALDEALSYAMERTVFGRPLIKQQQVAAMIAESSAELAAARLLVYRGAYDRDMTGRDISLEVAQGKLFATERAQVIIDRCLQIHGGLGVKVGHPLERLYREIRALRIYEGASEIQRVIIARELQQKAKQ